MLECVGLAGVRVACCRGGVAVCGHCAGCCTRLSWRLRGSAETAAELVVLAAVGALVWSGRSANVLLLNF